MAKEAEQRAQQQQAQSAQEGALTASQIIKNTGLLSLFDSDMFYLLFIYNFFNF
jgi:hypothetical protein